MLLFSNVLEIPEFLEVKEKLEELSKKVQKIHRGIRRYYPKLQ